MVSHEPIKTERYLRYAIVVIVLILLVLGIFFIQEYRAARRAQIIDDIHRGVPLNASDITIIRPWMTFDYINRIFNIPSDYLKNTLMIADPSYPRLSLSSYAQYNHMDPTMVVNEVESAVNDYLTNSGT